MPVYLIGTLDTKGSEIGFVRDLLREYGVETRTVDAGCLGAPEFVADVSREEVFTAAGVTLDEIQEAGDRGRAVTSAAVGVAEIVAALEKVEGQKIVDVREV